MSGAYVNYYSIKKSLYLILVVFKKTGCFVRGLNDLSTLSTDAAGQLDVLGHDGDTLGTM